MNSSFLYHAWGLYQHNCLCEKYKGNTIILHLQSKDSLKCCPKCGHAHWVKNGFHTRDFINHCCPVNFQTAEKSIPKPFRIGLRAFFFKKQAP